ncbi:MAG TPA: cupredoxin domain-containing protein [Gemmatimonadales bacterium]
MSFVTLSFHLATLAATSIAPPPAEIQVQLSEWKVELSAASVPAGPVRFIVHNQGSIPHGFEVEGGGLEKEIELIQPGASDTLEVALKSGPYEIYCPVGGVSHKNLGMDVGFTVTGSNTAEPAMAKPYESMQQHVAAKPGEAMAMAKPTAKEIAVEGGGPVIQILPGPFPFPDSAAPVLKAFGDEREGLESQVKNGPYSNNVSPISGRFSFTAWDLGAARDSVDGNATFITKDGSHWRLLLDRVQTKDVPHHPRFGGVIMGLYYHGTTEVHTPLVPTINSKVALWAVGRLYRDDKLVTDNAQVHVMLLSRTRQPGTWALACWDCSRNPIEELQLQILPGPGEPKFDAPGGFLFVNWEKSGSTTPANQAG